MFPSWPEHGDKVPPRLDGRFVRMRRGLGGRVRRLRVAAIPAVFVFLASCASHAPQDSLKPAGPIAHKIDNLFFPVFGVAAVVST